MDIDANKVAHEFTRFARRSSKCGIFGYLYFFHFVCMIVQTRLLINQFLFALRKYVVTNEIVITIKVKMEGLPSAEHQLLPAEEHIS
jgi:hypothetical protein